MNIRTIAMYSVLCFLLSSSLITTNIGFARQNTSSDANLGSVRDVLSIKEVKWLEDNQDYAQTVSFRGGAVYFSGFFREDELSPNILSSLSKQSIFPRILHVEQGTEKFEPIKIVWHEVPGQPGLRCASLVQIVHGRNAAQGRGSAEQEILNWIAYLPPKPLNANCDIGDTPPVPEGYLERLEIEGTYPVLREEQRSCADFPSLENAPISLVQGMRIDFRAIIPSTAMPRSRYDRPHLHFEFFMRGFQSALYRSGFEGTQILPYGNYSPRETDLRIELRAIEDSGEDVFCYVADITQGQSRQRFLLREPRNGKSFSWTPDRAQEFHPGSLLIDFGRRVASSLGATS
ncbi:MAG: hypothetical protein KJZ64_10375 [Sphingomonadaceae bacterium]|nr:hypothetical protein [Sphingomonadaceae bacterium]